MTHLDDLLEAVRELRAVVQAEAGRGAWVLPAGDVHASGAPRYLAVLSSCTLCSRSKARTAVVVGSGPASCSLAVVLDPPGVDEDAASAPLTGAANTMLDKMLTNVLGLPRRQVLVTSAIKCVGPRGDVGDAAACRPWLDAQLDACRPTAILVMGELATHALFGAEVRLQRHRGLWRTYRGIDALPTLHPRTLVEQPRLKRAVFEDLKAMKVRLG